ncbi:MAG: hypothetical protein RIB47_03035 [Cyclobacteriaceae bacterium]
MWVLIALCVFAGTGFLLWRFQQNQSDQIKVIYWIALALRVAAGVGVGLVYTYYYSAGDTFGYFSDSLILHGLFADSPEDYFRFLMFSQDFTTVLDQLANTQTRSLFLVKVVSVFGLVANSNYWLTAFYFSIISFLSAWFLMTQIMASYPGTTRAAIVSFLFFPSVVFWSSGITKECLAMSALMLVAGVTLKYWRQNKLTWLQVLTLIVSVYFLWNLKYYWAALFLPSAFSCVLVTEMRKRIPISTKPILSITVFLIVFCSLALLVSRLHPNFYLERLLDVIVDNYETYLPLSGANAAVHFTSLERNWTSIIVNSPWGLFSGLFRPLIFEINSLFQFGISIENLILLVLSFYNLRYLGEAWRSQHITQIVGILLFIVLLSIFLTLSTPNFGTLSRYRIAFLPFFSYLLLVNILPRFDAFRNLEHP